MTHEIHCPHTWLIDDRLVLAERPGGGGREHRIAARNRDFDMWHAHGIRHIVSGMRSRHGLIDAALYGFGVSWCPITDGQQAHDDIRALVSRAIDRLDLDTGGVLVHVDRPGEVLAAVAVRFRFSLGLAGGVDEAVRQVLDLDPFPFGDTARRLTNIEVAS